jgi:hypothetical protein
MQPNVGDLPEEQRPLDIVAAYKLVRSLIEAVMTASRI